MTFPSLTDAPVRWSVLVRRSDGTELFAVAPDRVLPAASVGKLALLDTVARQIEAGVLDPAEPLTRTPEDAVEDSGIWRHLAVPALSVADAARLVGLVSDNLATNVLMRRLGGPAALGSGSTVGDPVLHDVVRDRRGPEHPPTLSTASAAGCLRLWDRTSGAARAFLDGGLDLSMVAGAFGLDPLAHGAPDRGWSVVHKTGTDTGVRADTGIVHGPRGSATYAALAHWQPDSPADPVRDDVLATMHQIGRALRAALA